MIPTDFLDQLDKFSLIIKKKVTSNFSGEKKTEVVGSGLLFRDYSSYSPGDDFKHIDWKVYGRTNKLVVKRFEEDRNLTVHVLIDFSGSMNFGSKLKKHEYASMIGLGFVYIAMGNNERFVLSTFDDTFDFFQPRKGAHNLVAIVEYLNNKKARGVSNFHEALVKYKSLINSRSLIVIISDFLYDLDILREVLFRFKNNKIKLIQVLDKTEKKMDLEGDYELVDLESSDIMKTYIDPSVRSNYLNDLAKHNAKIKELCSEVNADFYSFSNSEDIFEVFYKILR